MQPDCTLVLNRHFSGLENLLLLQLYFVQLGFLLLVASVFFYFSFFEYLVQLASFLFFCCNLIFRCFLFVFFFSKHAKNNCSNRVFESWDKHFLSLQNVNQHEDNLNRKVWINSNLTFRVCFPFFYPRLIPVCRHKVAQAKGRASAHFGK